METRFDSGGRDHARRASQTATYRRIYGNATKIEMILIINTLLFVGGIAISP